MFYALDDSFHTPKLSILLNNLLCHPDSSAIDYFTYEFTETEIRDCWSTITSSYRDILNKPVSSDMGRLENIAWRKWGQLKSKTKTIDARELNWHKENDCCWLYGPLLTHKVSQKVECGKDFEIEDLAESVDDFCLSSSVDSVDSIFERSRRNSAKSNGILKSSGSKNRRGSIRWNDAVETREFDKYAHWDTITEINDI